MLWNLECSVEGKEKYVRISMKEIWRDLDVPPKNKELWSYVVKFAFIRPKSSSVSNKGSFICTIPQTG